MTDSAPFLALGVVRFTSQTPTMDFSQVTVQLKILVIMEIGGVTMVEPIIVE